MPRPRHPDPGVKILVIGAGLAGLSTAVHLDGEAHVVDADIGVGGKVRTENLDGFRFDVTGHWLHLRDPAIRRLVLDVMGPDDLVEIERTSRIWSHGVYTRYPFQANTFGLPPEIIKTCLMGAIEAAWARRSSSSVGGEVGEPESFADWVRHYFGDGIADHFMIPYNAKLWGVPATEITSRWCQRFVPKPRLDDIVAGAVGCNERAMGYNARFLYPRAGGIQRLPEALARRIGPDRISLGRRVVSIDLGRRRARFSDGGEMAFDGLVNTMPLPELVGMIDDAPAEIRRAGQKLRWMDVPYFNVGVRGELGVSDHWIYVPEAQWPMYRVGSFSNAVSTMAPDQCGSLYVELADRRSSPEALVGPVKKGLLAMGIIDDVRQIQFMAYRQVKCAYVIYDFEHHENRSQILSWLEASGVMSIGRYGDWNYSAMEDALIDGRRAAERLGRA